VILRLQISRPGGPSEALDCSSDRCGCRRRTLVPTVIAFGRKSAGAWTAVHAVIGEEELTYYAVAPLASSPLDTGHSRGRGATRPRSW